MTNKNKLIQIGSWALIGLLTAAVIFFTFFFKESHSSIRYAGWIIWFVLTVAVFFLTTQGQKARSMLLSAKEEIRKVTWPAKKETIQTTAMVGVFVFGVSIILWIYDSMLIWVVSRLTRITGN